VEPYDFANFRVYHFDLYRLGEAEELEYMGVRDYFGPRCLSLLEWPERGMGILPQADLSATLSVIDSGRELHIAAESASGESVLVAMRQLI
jgi:tRNA threonylcarbamoyladenosine biosynthesis protein TsaE